MSPLAHSKWLIGNQQTDLKVSLLSHKVTHLPRGPILMGTQILCFTEWVWSGDV